VAEQDSQVLSAT